MVTRFKDKKAPIRLKGLKFTPRLRVTTAYETL